MKTESTLQKILTIALGFIIGVSSGTLPTANGKTVEVDALRIKKSMVTSVDESLTVILLMDVSGSAEFRIKDIENSAIEFVRKLKPEVSVMVIQFDDRLKVRCQPTTDRKKIEKAIKGSHSTGGTRLYDAVDEVLKKHLATLHARAVVLLTDGVDTTSRRATYESTLRDAETAGASFYSLDYDTEGRGSRMSGQGITGLGGLSRPGSPSPASLRVPRDTSADYRRGQSYLRALSERTGGRFYAADSRKEIEKAFASIAEEIGGK